MSSVNFAESLDILARIHRIPEDEIRRLVEPLLGEGLEVDAPVAEDAWTASSLRGRYYSRQARELSLADCFLLAAALKLEAPVATADPAVAATAREESIELIPLPDSAGRRP